VLAVYFQLRGLVGVNVNHARDDALDVRITEERGNSVGQQLVGVFNFVTILLSRFPIDENRLVFALVVECVELDDEPDLVPFAITARLLVIGEIPTLFNLNLRRRIDVPFTEIFNERIAMMLDLRIKFVGHTLDVILDAFMQARTTI